MELDTNGKLDAALGAPLVVSQAGSRKGKGQLGEEDNDPVTPTIRPLLYRMYVAAQVLRLGAETRYSALVLLHRYAHAVYGNTGKLERPSQWVAAACLFLATKSEEEPRRLRDMINLAYMILDVNGEESVGGVGVINLDIDPPPLDEAYWETKKKLVETEQMVLRWLGFDVFVSHPHRAVALLLYHLPLEDQERLAPTAARKLNDGLFHGPALQHDTLALACAAIKLSLQEDSYSKQLMVEDWWKNYVSEEELRSTVQDLNEATDLLKRLSEKQGR